MRRKMVYLVPALVFLSVQLSYGATVKIGVVSALTGPVAAGGLHTKNGLEIALDEINAKGGIPGIGKIELIYEDDKCIPPETVNAVTKLVYRDKVLAVIGTNCSSATLAGMVVTQKAQTPHITTVSSSAAITQKGNPWIFRTAIVDSTRAQVLAEFAVKALKAKNIGVIHDSDDYGRDGADAFIGKLKNLNVEPKIRESFNRKDKDFSGQLVKAKGTGVDLLCIWGLPEESALLATQAKDMILNIRVMGGDPITNPAFIELAGPASEGVFSAVDFVKTDPSPKIQEFVKKYESRFNIPPSTVAAKGYECLYLLAQAIEKSGLDKDKLRDAISKIRFEGITGITAFDANGGNLQKPFPVIIKNRLVYKYE
jgi:branched-chain amino acid transport system substrate-binding protein